MVGSRQRLPYPVSKFVGMAATQPQTVPSPLACAWLAIVSSNPTPPITMTTPLPDLIDECLKDYPDEPPLSTESFREFIVSRMTCEEMAEAFRKPADHLEQAPKFVRN